MSWKKLSLHSGTYVGGAAPGGRSNTFFPTIVISCCRLPSWSSVEAYDRVREELALAASTTCEDIRGSRSGRYFLSWGKEMGWGYIEDENSEWSLQHFVETKRCWLTFTLVTSLIAFLSAARIVKLDVCIEVSGVGCGSPSDVVGGLR